MIPLTRDLVLLGGGHAHLAVLRRLGMQPQAGLRITLVSTDSETPYSGMLPGHVAGVYQHDEMHFDLRALAGFAAAGFIATPAQGIDTQNNAVLFDDRPPLNYDLLSINTGSTPELSSVPGAREHVLPVKPIHQLLGQLNSLLHSLDVDQQSTGLVKKIAIVGGGAGGIELAFALRQRFRNSKLGKTRLHLVSATERILPTMPVPASKIIEKLFKVQDISLSQGQRVTEVREQQVVLADGKVIEADAILWVTSASAPPWPRESGLACDEQGFIRTSNTLQSVSHSNVFAAGDVSSMDDQQRPRSGVIAVRQGRVLADNIIRALNGQTLREYRAQKNQLALLGTGDGKALAVRGSVALHGRIFWHLKESIDRRFMRRYQLLNSSAGMNSDSGSTSRGTTPMHCLGCGAKVGATVLREVLNEFTSHSNIADHSSLSAGDDAAIIELPVDSKLVHSVDVFPAICDDLYLLGSIAANHALNDILAMGAKPHSALAIITLPYATEKIHTRMLRTLLSGAAAVFKNCKVVLNGGHTNEGPQLQVGFAVTGFTDASNSLRYQGGQAGDSIVVTGALGSGILFAGAMRGLARAGWIDQALARMAVSNAQAASIMQSHGAHSATDISGFGLLGHIGTLFDSTQLCCKLDCSAIPILSGADKLLQQGVRSSLHPANLNALPVALRNKLDTQHHLLCDPQTSGPLVFSLPPGSAEACIQALRNSAYPAAVIGELQKAEQANGAGLTLA